ncbi:MULTISPECIES: glycerophosphoryl diester phosphodiesterase membrane domain-containing protein [unclassified Microcoleus]|uniref:glycerophosphoryl diester phosphodiesterase membrane domain-containing protein n=1 Tax=unclassified Microcoleus TaxID=2642155 RepID=UPI0025D8A7A5|nr:MULTISPECIES: glycerophosphoryl diester phosphodiesterase membrane domain-containing protein [unclassified Microcoleus]
MTAQRISAISLLRETFAAAGAIYAPQLTINSPSLIFAVLNSVGLGSAAIPLNIIYWFVAIPFLSGSLIFYTYRSLTGNQVTVSEAFHQANRRLLPLILVYIISFVLIFAGFIALIIPGLYVSYRLIFPLYATVIDNSSALDSLSSSWELTKGRWWLIFRSTFLIFFVVIVPTILISLLIDPTAKSLASKLTANVLGFLVAPLMSVYFVLLYQRLRESATTMK